MKTFILIIWVSGGGVATKISEYPDMESCTISGNKWDAIGWGYRHICIEGYK